jgi:4-nitrophenol 2-monooxygenase / 4-nitrocatechol 4-monooxygenase, reductase component
MAIDDARFRQALGHFASGVTVVTTELEGMPYGMTVSAFSSVSLRPPLVLICIDKGVGTHDAITKAGRFAVSILRRDQEAVSRQFATRGPEKFSGIAIDRGALGLPLVQGALARIECSLHATFDGGDHTIFVGRVEHADLTEGPPLLYFRGGYRQLAP